MEIVFQLFKILKIEPFTDSALLVSDMADKKGKDSKFFSKYKL